LQAIIAKERETVAVESNVKVAKLPIYNRKISKIEGFIMICRLYLRMRMRRVIVEEQIQ